MFNEGRNAEIEAYTKNIEEIKKVEYMLTARKDIIEISRVRLACFPNQTYQKKLHHPTAPNNNYNKPEYRGTSFKQSQRGHAFKMR